MRIPDFAKFFLLCFTLLQALGGAAGQAATLPLWPHSTPEPPQVQGPEKDVATAQDRAAHGPQTVRLTDVTVPTMTVFLPSSGSSKSTAGAIVFPGGAYQRLAWDWEGLDTCKWLNSIGMACLLVKYRVPEKGMYPENPADLEDAQQAMRLARAHAAEWHIDPKRLGVMGFSAGGHLAVTLSTHWDDHHVESTPAAPDVDARISAHPAFAILVYPAYLYFPDDHEKFNPVMTPVKETPPTFIIQAENDKTYIDSALNYYRALKNAGTPAELHLYATGGHGFGMHPAGQPEEHWPDVAATWLRGLGMLQ